VIEAVAVVVPARDEQQLIARCLESVHASLPSALPSTLVVVADGCTDETVAIARSCGAVVVEADFANVGAARRLGVDAALATWPELPRESIWIANTDADSWVPSHWIRHQLDLAEAGADVVVGTVRPDFAELPHGYRDAWLQTHRPGEPNGHVHGANLGVRASVYARAGGFARDAEHEDTRLVDRLVLAGASLVASDAAEVITSGRRVGRTPGGYAGYLREAIARASIVARPGT
jgi:glycosyltransferase involved in cell wall biosynthesis